MDSEKDRKIQELTHQTNEKMDAIAKEMSQIKDSDLDDRIKNEKIHSLGENFRQLLEDETKQIEEIENYCNSISRKKLSQSSA